MWLRSQDLNKINDHVTLYGKSLILSQKYEVTCKDIIKMFNIVFSLDNKEYDFMRSEYLSYVDKLNRMLLGNALRSMTGKEGIFGISEDEMIILHKAREARNWIVHKSGEELFQKRFTQGKFMDFDEEYLNIFKKHIINLSRGDYFVSQWSYEFYEKEYSNYIGEEKYIEMISNWIFTDRRFKEEEYFA